MVTELDIPKMLSMMIAKCCKFVALNCPDSTSNSSVSICTFTSCLWSGNLITIVEVLLFYYPPTLANILIIAYFNNPERNVESKNCYISIDLNLGNFSGNDGCNIINGKVKIKGKAITFTNILRTKRACKNMEQGNVFVKNLNDVNRYEVKGGELFLYKNDLLIMTLESFR